ncbi:MAG: UDP-N-acetylmuramate--L-alanine ligase [Treponema sp.]|nr:UDP-N-acetylmuramate--L-alanine ligase [Treponema sp.]
MEIDRILKPDAFVYFVGIKGTGVCAFAELMHNNGIKVSGSDINEVFYTDAILDELKISYHEGFDSSHIESGIDLIIHSAAYSADTNPELARAQELGIPAVKYTDALGEWSAKFDSTGICGVHGKTTTTAICGVMMRAASLPAQILAGSASVDFEKPFPCGDNIDTSRMSGRSTLNLGNKYFIAETCEYRNHFLSFRPRRIILTSVESDHQDFFPTYESIRDAFVQYCRLLPDDGQLFYCADDPGAVETAQIIKNDNRGIELVPYGFTADGGFKITSYNIKDKKAVFSIAGFPDPITMNIPGRHEALNTAAALALTISLAREESGTLNANILTEGQIKSIREALAGFESTKRRSEVFGEVSGIIFMDDYGHHPTAIKTTLEGIKSFYPSRRLVVSFMSHTYTRTSALFDRFAQCFNDADVLFLHKIYASARENYKGGVNGRTLYEKTSAVRSALGDIKKETYYIDEVDDAFKPLCEILKSGDIFVTLGAGSNRPLGEKLFAHFKEVENG